MGTDRGRAVLAMLAALGLALALGAYAVSRGPGPAAAPEVSPAPAVSATSGPSIHATAVPASCAPELTRVYFARDQLPPVAGMVRGICGRRGGVIAEIGDRLSALLGARLEDVPPGAFTATGRTPTGGRQSTISTSIAVDGDLATVEIGVDPPWAARGAALSQALLQQLIYTITEAPGIRRARLKDPDKQTFTIDQLVVDKPLSREDVFGYRQLGSLQPLRVDGTSAPARLSSTYSVDSVSPGVAQFVITMDYGSPSAVSNALPQFTATLGRTNMPEGKFELEITIPNGSDVTTTATQVNRSPLRWIAVGKSNSFRSQTYRLGLDDQRPWRAVVLSNPTRIVVDIGGAPQAVSDRIALYAPAPLMQVSRTFVLSGAARVFEANVLWRVKDSTQTIVAQGHTTATIGTSPVWGAFQTQITLPASARGNVTTEVYEVSATDGSEVGLVAIPVAIR